jgi:hypothetical protein
MLDGGQEAKMIVLAKELRRYSGRTAKDNEV